jgi:catechol 2,3-dioxygenase-like lactoylglutathione lyase family enzyme
MIKGLSHITFVVKDLKNMSRLLTAIFDAREVYDSGPETFSIAPEKYFLVNGIWIAIIEGDSSTSRSYHHVAFQIHDDDFEDYADRIESLGIEILPGRDRNPSEGRSLYFYDYDNHLFELHTGTLKDRLAYYSESTPGN